MILYPCVLDVNMHWCVDVMSQGQTWTCCGVVGAVSLSHVLEACHHCSALLAHMIYSLICLCFHCSVIMLGCSKVLT